MSSGGGSHVETVGGSAQACFDVITSWETYPEWQSAVKACAVLESDPAGAWDLVETIIDARLRSVRYVLRYHYEEPGRIWWEYVEGDLRAISGDYDLDDQGDGTTLITYRLDIDAGVFVPSPVKRFLTETAMKTSVREVKDRVERAAP